MDEKCSGSLTKEIWHKKFNVVGHSMGNMSIMFYLLNYGGDKNLPQIQKQVDIAGHFNGILGMDDKLGESKLDKNVSQISLDRVIRNYWQLEIVILRIKLMS